MQRLTLPPSVVCRLPLQTVWTQIRPDGMSGLIWIQAVWHWWYLKKSAHDKKAWKNTQEEYILARPLGYKTFL